MPRLRDPSAKKVLFAGRILPALAEQIDALREGRTDADILAEALPLWVKARRRAGGTGVPPTPIDCANRQEPGATTHAADTAHPKS